MTQLSPTPQRTRAPAQGTERRAAVRYASHPDAWCQARAAAADDAEPAVLLDISTLGLGLVLTRHFPPGTVLSCELMDPARDEVLVRQVRVVHTTDQGGCWIHGCVFSDPLGAEELRRFV